MKKVIDEVIFTCSKHGKKFTPRHCNECKATLEVAAGIQSLRDLREAMESNDGNTASTILQEMDNANRNQ